MSDKRFNLTRRKALLGLGGIGAGAALGGAGTMAFLNDPESITGNAVTDGNLDLKLDWWTFYKGRQVETDEQEPADNPGPMIDLDDVKPGDYGSGCISLHLYDNPAWVWAGGEIHSNAENGQNEPERETEGKDEDGMGELADALRFIILPLGYCDRCDGNTEREAREYVRSLNPTANPFNPEFEPFAQGTFREAFGAMQSGYLLDGWPQNTTDTHCLQPLSTYYLGFLWWLPKDVGNEVQGDSLTFDFDFYAEQCRHNAEPKNPYED
ncbi:hypothetical protein [Haladaptatus sp. NG-SE-30]